MKKAIGMLLALAFCLTACAPATAPESAAADTADTAQQEASAPASAAGALPAGALRSSGTLGDTGEARYTVASSLQDFTPGTAYELQVLRLDYATARQDCIYTVEMTVGEDGLTQSGSLLVGNDAVYLFVGTTMYKIPLEGGEAETMTIQQEIYPAAADDTSVYYFVFDEHNQYSGLRMDLTTGQCTELQLPPQTWDIWAVGESRFLLCRLLTDTPLPGPQEGDAYNAALQNATCEYDWYDPATGALEKMMTEPYYGTEQPDGSSRQHRFLGAGGGRLYFNWYGQVDGQIADAGVESCDMTGGDWQPLTAIPEGVDGGEMGMQNGSLRWIGSYLATNDCLIYDVTTGKTWENVPIDNNWPVAFTGDGRLLVDNSITEESGEFHEAYGLVDLEDYLNGTGEVTPVTLYNSAA